jgi:hypothetical protein
MPFAYYERLSPARRSIYRRSDAITTLGLPPGIDAGEIVNAIANALAREHRIGLKRASQQLVDALVGGYRVPRVTVRVLARRPTDDYGELHGLYEPVDALQERAERTGRPPRARITVWMRTAKRRQVVAFKSFLRTLVHEIAHHLDYELFLLEETFHTEGFYKRESSLANALLAQAAALCPVTPRGDTRDPP